MVLRKRLDRIEKTVGVGRCPNCRILLVRPGAHLAAEERHEQIVQICQTTLAERGKPGPSHTAPEPAEPMCCPGCGEPLPASAINAIVPPFHQLVAAVIEAEQREAKGTDPQPQQYGQEYSSITCSRT